MFVHACLCKVIWLMYMTWHLPIVILMNPCNPYTLTLFGLSPYLVFQVYMYIYIYMAGVWANPMDCNPPGSDHVCMLLWTSAAFRLLLGCIDEIHRRDDRSLKPEAQKAPHETEAQEGKPWLPQRLTRSAYEVPKFSLWPLMENGG